MARGSVVKGLTYLPGVNLKLSGLIHILKDRPDTA